MNKHRINCKQLIGFNYDTDYVLFACKATKKELLEFLKLHGKDYSHHELKPLDTITTKYLRSAVFNSNFIKEFKIHLSS